MLPKILPAQDGDHELIFEKIGTGDREGETLSGLGAFVRGEVLRLRVRCPRALGAAAIVLRLRPDGG